MIYNEFEDEPELPPPARPTPLELTTAPYLPGSVTGMTLGIFRMSPSSWVSSGYIIAEPPKMEKIYCAYCGRRHARGQEICNGCGATLA